MNRVLLVDDHPVFRCGMATLLNAESDIEVCGEASSVPKALQLIQQLKPDLLIVDLMLDEGDGLQLIKHLRAQGNNLPILVISMYDEQLFAERVIKAGANGFLNKTDAIGHIIPAIRRVFQGRIYLSDTAAEKLIQTQFHSKNKQEMTAQARLSDRELEVFMMLGRGYPTKRIAQELHLSSKTVDSHKEHIKKKLDIADNTSLIHHAVSWMLNR